MMELGASKAMGFKRSSMARGETGGRGWGKGRNLWFLKADRKDKRFVCRIDFLTPLETTCQYCSGLHLAREEIPSEWRIGKKKHANDTT